MFRPIALPISLALNLKPTPRLLSPSPRKWPPPPPPPPPPPTKTPTAKHPSIYAQLAIINRRLTHLEETIFPPTTPTPTPTPCSFYENFLTWTSEQQVEDIKWAGERGLQRGGVLERVRGLTEELRRMEAREDDMMMKKENSVLGTKGNGFWKGEQISGFGVGDENENGDLEKIECGEECVEEGQERKRKSKEGPTREIKEISADDIRGVSELEWK